MDNPERIDQPKPLKDGSNPIFQLQNVHFSYLGKYPALCGIDINILPGQRIAIIGANGSGKSTLLQMLDGLIFPDRGTIKAFGRQLNESVFNEEEFNYFFRRNVGLVFQNPEVQLFCPTVKEDIIFGPLQLGFSKEEIKRNLDVIVEILNIKNLINRSPHQLSVGEKRKVAIASTLIFAPEVILLDEPTAGLDPRTSRELIDLLMKYHEAGKTLITATHDLHIVEEISDTIYVFSQDKKIVKSGSTNEILEDRALLQSNNLVHIHSHKHKGKIHTHSHQHLEHHLDN